MGAVRKVAATLALVAVVGGTSSCGMLESSSTSDAPPTTAAQPAPEPAPTVTETVTATPTPAAQVLLTDQGVGDVSFGSPGAYERLVDLLGDPTRELEVGCSFQYAEWGGLTVFFHDNVDDGLGRVSRIFGGDLVIMVG